MPPQDYWKSADAIKAAPQNREIKFIFLGLLNLAVSIPLGFFGFFFAALSGGNPYPTYAMEYTSFILVVLPLYFFVSSILLFSHYFRKTKTSGNQTALLVYVIIPWALLALLFAASTFGFI